MTSGAWRRARLGSLVEAKYGKALPSGQRKGGPVPVYGSNGAVGWHNVALTRGPAIVIGRKGSSGAVNLSPVPCWPIDTTYFIDEPGPFRLDFLDYLLRSLGLTQLDRSTAIPGLNREQLYDLEVPIPPPSEQLAVVSFLRATGDLRSSADDHLATVRQMTGRFRQSVLVAACAGRLTANWRASAPKQSSVAETLEEMRSAEGRRKVRRGVNAAAKTDADLAHLNLPKTWSVSTVAALLLGGVLRDVKDGNHGANHPKASEFADVGLPFITANCVHDGIIDYRGAPKVRGQALGRLRVGFAEPRDVVLTHKASVGRVAINTEPCVLTPQTTYYRTADSVLAPEYLALFFESIYYYRQLAAVMSQTTRDFVPISEQYLLSVILPPRDEQDEIVRRVTPMLTMAESITARARQASDRIDRASLAVLNKSLRGEIARSQVGLGEPVEGNEPANRAASAGSGPSRVRAKIATQNRGHRGPTRAT